MAELEFDEIFDQYVSLSSESNDLSWDERWDEGNWGERYGDTRD